MRWISLPFQSVDMSRFLVPWIGYIVEHGRFRSLADDFYDYAPAYIYLLDLATFFRHAFHAITLVKLVTFLFEIAAAVLIYRLTMVAWSDRRRAFLCALLFLNLPTVILNGSVWGQCDVIYTTFLLGFLYFILQSRPIPAAAMYGLALSFKLQSIFLAPFLLILIARKRMPRAALLIVPAVYVALTLPAVAAGRPFWSLMTIYARQAGENDLIALGAPNIPNLIKPYVAPEAMSFAIGLNLAIAAVLSAVLLAMQLRSRRSLPAECIVIGSTFWLALEPMVLPKMHERYFFAADIFAFVLALWMPRRWWIAVLFQVGSALACSTFLLYGAARAAELRLFVLLHGAEVASALVILGTASVGLLLWRGAKQPLAS